MAYTKIRVEPFLDESALRIVLNAPKANVLDSVMMGELNDLLERCRARPELKLLAFVGEGPNFSFGASVEEHVGERAALMLEAFHGLFLRLVDLSIPTAAAVNGRCLGGGMELATFCGRVFASPKAILAQPEIQLGVLPPVASVVLPARCGQAVADEVILTGRNVEAEEAREMGLVDELAANPLEALEAWATKHLAGKSASSLRLAQEAARWRFNRTLKKDLRKLEKFYLDTLMDTHDANEGLASFLEKRAPEWRND